MNIGNDNFEVANNTVQDVMDVLHSSVHEREIMWKGPSTINRPNLESEFDSMANHLHPRNLMDDPLYDAHSFCRYYCVSRAVCDRVHDAISCINDSFAQKANCTEKLRISAQMRVTSAVCVLSGSTHPDAMKNYLSTSETTTCDTLNGFLLLWSII